MATEVSGKRLKSWEDSRNMDLYDLNVSYRPRLDRSSPSSPLQKVAYPQGLYINLNERPHVSIHDELRISNMECRLT